jgi:hypothetical protein
MIGAAYLLIVGAVIVFGPMFYMAWSDHGTARRRADDIRRHGYGPR